MPATQPPLIVPEDDSQDRAYFIITPQLVWALCENVYQLALWTTVKMIAGEDGACFLETGDLATAAMMSVGKCSQTRTQLLAKGLLSGHIYRDPGFPRPVWHLTIPDLWARNIAWRQLNRALKDRITAKREQRSLHLVKEAAFPSPGEIHPSPGETSPSPGETKKIHEIQEEEQRIMHFWEQIARELRLQMMRSTFATWIAPLHPTQIDDRATTLLCPNAYVLDWCENRLHLPIRRTIAGVLGVELETYTVTYRLATQDQPHTT